VQVTRPYEPDEAVAKILALQKDEDNENQHDADGLERRQRGSRDGLQEHQRSY
jgi:hypothetical protein